VQTGTGTIYASPAALVRIRAADYIELTKPRITFLILVATLVGFYIGGSGRIAVSGLLFTLLATGLVAGGSAALNMYAERRPDGLMSRTMNRPLPSGRLRESNALVFGLSISAVGLALLAAFVTPLTALLAAITQAAYLLLYTPLKKRTWLCTLVGAFPGALPIIIGWSAASARVPPKAWSLFAIVFFWQLPHFYAIGWMYRDEYARAGFSILPVPDRSGIRTARQVLASTGMLVLAGVTPALVGISGAVYLTGSLALGLIFLVHGFSFARVCDRVSARRLFVYSVFYLPLLFLLLLIDKRPV
jgi:protoheme IX farnesyltransferase